MRNSLASICGFCLVLCAAALLPDSSTTGAQEHPKRQSIFFGAHEKPIQKSTQIETFRYVFTQIAHKVVPSIVSVIPTKIDTVLFYKNPYHHFFHDDTSFDFPDRDNNSYTPDDKGDAQTQSPFEKRERRRQGLGAGVIVSKEGYVLTNYHVIADASEIEVQLSDNRSFPAKIIGSDSLCDVAVIKIGPPVPPDLCVAYLGNSDSLVPGEWVAAIGNPFSLTSTVTAGIVSALNRQVGDLSMFQNFIQTDAAINPGNSGGALVNVYGEVVGINTLIYSRTGGFMGIGFAIPINMARIAMEDLIYDGRVTRGWIGVGIQEIGSTARKALGLDEPGGALVTDVFKGQPGEKSGIRPGDVIMTVDKEKIDGANDFRNMISAKLPGTTVPLTISRNGRTLQINVAAARRETDIMVRPESKHQAHEIPEPSTEKSELYMSIGIDACDITPFYRSIYEVPEHSKGVVVTAVGNFIDDPREELKRGDLLTQIKLENKEMSEIDSRDQLLKLLKNAKQGQAVLLLVRHDTSSFFVAFTIDK